MKAINNENYHKLTKQTMENIFLPTNFNFIHKYKDNGHDLVSKDNGKYQCNITAVEELSGFYFLGKSKNLAIQNKLLKAIDNTYPLDMALYNETMRKFSEFYIDIHFIIEPFNMNGVENLTWSSFGKTKKISSSCWMNFNSSSCLINMYSWEKSSGYRLIPQIPKMIIVDIEEKSNYIQVIEASLPINNRLCKKIYISANKDMTYIYVLKENRYEIETIENVMKEVREAIISYSLNLLHQADCVDVKTIETEDYLKYVELHKMLII